MQMTICGEGNIELSIWFAAGVPFLIRTPSREQPPQDPEEQKKTLYSCYETLMSTRYWRPCEMQRLINANFARELQSTHRPAFKDPHAN